MIRQLVSFPESMIQRRFDRRGYALEIALVLVYGLIASLGMIYFFYMIVNADVEQIPRLQTTLAGHTVGPFITIFGIWLWYTVSAHFVAKVYSGAGRISRLLRTSAWALAPVAVWFLVRSIIQILLLMSYEMPPSIANLGFTTRAIITEILKEGLQSSLFGFDGPIYVLTLLLGIPFVAWSWYYLTLAVETVEGISHEAAQRVAAVSAGGLVLYILQSALQWL